MQIRNIANKDAMTGTVERSTKLGRGRGGGGGGGVGWPMTWNEEAE